MGTVWKGIVLGGPAGSISPAGGVLAALGLPAEFFYFKRIPLSPRARRGIRDLRGYAAGASDPDLPVAVEDCLIYCHPDAEGIVVFAIEKSKCRDAANDAAKSLGRPCDCIVPLPLAIWDGAASAASKRRDAFDGTLFHLHAAGERWMLCAGSVTGKGASPLKAVATISAGDKAGVRRAAAILASRLSAETAGTSPKTAVSISGGDASEELAAALADACGLREQSGASAVTAIDAAEAVAGYAKRHYLADDFPMVEAESDAVRRARSNRSLLPAAVAAIGAALLLAASASHDIAARRALRATDAETTAAATQLAGMPLRRKGPAAIAPARNAFQERFPQQFRDFLSPAPRDILRTVFAFAVARDIDMGKIESDGSEISFTLFAERGDDVESLAEELRRAGFSASAGDAAPQMGAEEGRGVFLLTARMEVAR